MSKISLNTEQFLDSCARRFSIENGATDRQAEARSFIVATVRNNPEEATQILHEIEDNIEYSAQVADLHVNRIKWIIETIRK